MALMSCLKARPTKIATFSATCEAVPENVFCKILFLRCIRGLDTCLQEFFLDFFCVRS